MSKNKNQHYVSAFYLYNFTSEEQRINSKGNKRQTKIHHFDIAKGRLRERPIEKVATESYLLSYKDGGGNYNHTLDDDLKSVEDKASVYMNELSEILSRLVHSKSVLVRITNSLMDSIIEFICWQVRRNPETTSNIESDCKKHLIEGNSDISESKKMALKVVRNIGDYDKFNLFDELQKKNKRIIFTTTSSAQFITTDNPLVRFNKHDRDGVSIEGTEMYFPKASNILLLMSGNGNLKEFRVENDRPFLRKVNSYICKNAIKYIFGKSDAYINRVARARNLS